MRTTARRTATGPIIFVFLLPFLLLFVVFRLGPVLAALVFGFSDFNGIAAPRWIGLANYTNILFGTEAATKLFWKGLGNTLYYTVGELAIELVIGLGLAVLVNAKRLWGKVGWRIVYYAPVVTSEVAAATLWLWLYNPQVGLLNAVLEGLGLPRQTWLSNPQLAMPAIIVMSAWRGVGWSMVIYLAGLQGIPEELYEATRIDGAKGWQQFLYLTVPLLAPVTLFIIVIGSISGLQMMAQVYATTRGGPLDSTITVTYHMYEHAFRFFRLGYASAMAMLLFVVTFVISILNTRVFGRQFEY